MTKEQRPVHVLEKYEAHVKDERTSNLAGNSVSYCGASLGQEFHFLDATHAICAKQSGSTTLPCPACVKKMVEILAAD